MTHALGAVAPLMAAKQSSNGSSTLLIFVVIGAAFYFLIYRPQQKKQRAAKAQASAYEVGDEVVTAGGIVGRVIDITDDRVTLETSVGASFTVLRPYVLRKLEPAEPPQDVVGESDAQEPEPPAEPGEPPPGGAPTDAAPGDATPHDAAPGRGAPGDAPDGGPTPPARPADGGDGTDTGGADGPPII